MRRKLIPLLALCMLLFSGCVQNTRNSYDVPDNYSVGIIRTNGSRNSSDILYFDANLSQTVPFTMIMQQWRIVLSPCNLPMVPYILCHRDKQTRKMKKLFFAKI